MNAPFCRLLNGLAPMRRISSRLTWWSKKFFPAFWFGLIGVVGTMMAVKAADGRVPGKVLLILLALAVFGYVMLRWLVFPLMDEVWIDGDDLVVRNHGQDDRFPITNIIDVEGSYVMRPEHVGIILQSPSRFGKGIRFAAPYRVFMFGTHPVAQELADRSGCFNRGQRR
jgi:hypothetical protein